MPLFVLSPASLAHSALFAGYYSYLAGNVFSVSGAVHAYDVTFT